MDLSDKELRRIGELRDAQTAFAQARRGPTAPSSQTASTLVPGPSSVHVVEPTSQSPQPSDEPSHNPSHKSRGRPRKGQGAPFPLRESGPPWASVNSMRSDDLPTEVEDFLQAGDDVCGRILKIPDDVAKSSDLRKVLAVFNKVVLGELIKKFNIDVNSPNGLQDLRSRIDKATNNADEAGKKLLSYLGPVDDLTPLLQKETCAKLAWFCNNHKTRELCPLGVLFYLAPVCTDIE
ncbi:MAG: hypothetical protein Q9174_005124 [Haloplaca sp. 1 TL-2023]